VDQATRDWAIVAGGQVARMVLGLVPSVLIARALGTADFGVYGVLAATSNITGVIADLGLTATAARHIAAVWPAEPVTAQQQGRVFFWTRLILAVVILSLGLLLAGPLAHRVLRLATDQATLALRLALLSVGATALSGAMTGLLQASRQFKQLTLVSLFNTGLTAILAIGLTLAGRLDLILALVILSIGASLATFIVGRRLLPRPFDLQLPPGDVWQSEGRRFLRFSRWIAMSNILAVLTAQLDILLLNRWGTPASVGIYFLALNLVAKTDIVNQSQYTVLLPTASALQSTADVRAYLRQALKRSLSLTLALLPLFFLVTPFVHLFYGPAFALAAPLFRLLLAVVIFDAFTIPVILLAFPLNKPRLLAAADALRAGALIGGALWLIPIYGPVGVIAAKGVAKVIGFLFTIAVLRWRKSL
jgi:O-antigen/teichoic acid export membrane protein